MRKFEKISKSQFSKDVPDGKYNDIVLPERKTKYSAGYDFISVVDVIVKAGQIQKIPTGIKVMTNNDEFFAMFVRSSMGIKHNIRMCNQVGIIDCDYYNNEDNEGHIWMFVQNHGKEDYKINKGDAFAQGIFMKYYVTDDDVTTNIRKGGVGSTDGSKK